MTASNSYRFTPLDVATYIKWSQLSGEQEYNVISSFWDFRKLALSKSSGTRFDTFKKRVYDELYKLWSRDFVNEHCPLERALDLKVQPPVLLPNKEAGLELYLKLMAIMLRLNLRLPFITMSWSDALKKTGIKKRSKALWTRIQKACEALGMHVVGSDGAPYSVSDFLSDKAALLSMRG